VGRRGRERTHRSAQAKALSRSTRRLNGKIIVRHNRARVRFRGTRHDDLMVIYLEGTPPRFYFDSEGHVIPLQDLDLPAAEFLAFESDGTQPGRNPPQLLVEKGSTKGSSRSAAQGSESKRT